MKQIILIAFAGFLSACGSPTVADADLMEAIQERENDWGAAYNAGDIDTLGEIYVEDAVFIAPGADPAWGRENIKTALSGFMGVLTDFEATADHVHAIGDDYAVEVGHATFNVPGEDGEPVPGAIDYLIVWNKGDDGVWRFAYDIFNPVGPGE